MRQSSKQVCEYMYILYYWCICVYIWICTYVFICTHTTDRPSYIALFIFSQLRNMWLVIIPFPFQISWWDITHSLRDWISIKTTVCTFVVIYRHIYGKCTYPHNLAFNADASWIMKQNVGKVLCIYVCAWNI